MGRFTQGTASTCSIICITIHHFLNKSQPYSLSIYFAKTLALSGLRRVRLNDITYNDVLTRSVYFKLYLSENLNNTD